MPQPVSMAPQQLPLLPPPLLPSSSLPLQLLLWPSQLLSLRRLLWPLPPRMLLPPPLSMSPPPLWGLLRAMLRSLL